MPHWNYAEVGAAAVVSPKVAHLAYLRSREVMQRMLKSDAKKVERALRERSIV